MLRHPYGSYTFCVNYLGNPQAFTSTLTCSSETHHWFLPDGRVVVQVVDLDVNQGPWRQSDAVDGDLVDSLPLNERHGAVQSHRLLDAQRQVLELSQVIPAHVK